MIHQAEGIIFISEQRERTLIGAKTQTPSIVINDNYLEGGLSYQSQKVENISVLIIPYIGDIEFESENEKQIIEENQIISFFSKDETTYKICNPYENDTINFYEVLIGQELFLPNKNIINLDVQTQKNQLLSIHETIRMGQYDSRIEGFFNLSNNNKQVFIYVLSGAFEVEDRLLKAHDSLLLWNIENIEFEALTNDAVILIIETDDTKNIHD
ncbi:MAG: hypothetical protein U5N85_14510 [Arcicella sp.]|nr:hypothetical protein [Arcicella sp.]